MRPEAFAEDQFSLREMKEMCIRDRPRTVNKTASSWRAASAEKLDAFKQHDSGLGKRSLDGSH